MATFQQPLTPEERLKTRIELKDILTDRIETLDVPEIYYSDLANLLSIPLTADDRRLFDLLDELSEKEHSQGRGFLSVIVIGKLTKRPGVGFFEMAERCGENTSNREAFYQAARQDVLDCWKA
ncbi:hypothetical protein [Pseudomonas sp. Irchel 3A7]|uniref:hypothetical protein n=1 Tax=Pseudomonas sp. Irchel 3A7 TaxID=2008913 RepID=UPI000BA3ACB2|nr:hypothetical protein [Pseudomonas sp. Irchel 3A7]